MAKRGYFQKIAQRTFPTRRGLRPANALLKRWEQVGEVDYTPQTATTPVPMDTPRPAVTRTSVEKAAAEPEARVNRERLELPSPQKQPRTNAPQEELRDREVQLDPNPSHQTSARLKPEVRDFLSEPAIQQPKKVTLAKTQEPNLPQTHKDLPVFQERILPRPAFAQDVEPATPKHADQKSVTEPVHEAQSPAVSEPQKLEPKTTVITEKHTETVVRELVPISPLPPEPRAPIPPARIEHHEPTIEIGSIEIQIAKPASQTVERQVRQVPVSQPVGRLSKGWQTAFGWRQS